VFEEMTNASALSERKTPFTNKEVSQNQPVKMYVYSKKVCAIAVFVVAFFRLRMAFCSPPNINLISLSALFSDDHAWMALTTPPKKIIIKKWYLGANLFCFTATLTGLLL